MRLIGLAGPARSGKDTVANILETQGWKTIAFADPLRRMLAAGFGSDALHQDKEAPLPGIGVSPRELLQTLGTEWGRETVDPDLWVRLADRRIREMHNIAGDDLNIAVTDVRFDNEAHWVRCIGGEVWHLRREDRPAVRDHTSEAGVTVEPGDQIIINDGTIGDLITTVSEALALIDERATA